MGREMPGTGFMDNGLMGTHMARQIFQKGCILNSHHIIRTDAESVSAQDDGGVSIAPTQHPSMPGVIDFGSIVVVYGPRGNKINRNSDQALGLFN